MGLTVFQLFFSSFKNKRNTLPKTPVWRPAVTSLKFWWIFYSAMMSNQFPWEPFSKWTLTSFNASVSCYPINELILIDKACSFWYQNLRLPNRSRGSRTGPCCLHFWTCASCWICCCPGTGQLTFTIMVRIPANTCVFRPSEPLPFWKSNSNCLNRPCCPYSLPCVSLLLPV